MKAQTKYLTLNIPSKMAFLNITPEVDETVRASGVQEGLVLVNTMHITSSVFINDDERGLHHDFGAGSRSWRRSTPTRITTTTTAPARTTPTRT